LTFFKIFSQKLFVEYITFDGWNCLRGIKNGVSRRRLLISSIYRVKKWNVKCTPLSPTSRPRTAPSSDPFKIDNNNTHRIDNSATRIGFNHF